MKKVKYKENLIRALMIFTPVKIVLIYLIFYFVNYENDKYRFLYVGILGTVVIAIIIFELLYIKLLYKHLETSRENQLKLSLFALQSQMNEHFWHNTIGMISLEAQLQCNNKITKMCSKLSKMLSFSASMGDGFCNLEEELQHAEHYMYLMKARFEDYFDYLFEVPEDMKQLRIPKFILQPICENAFLHAFKDKEPVWRIHIKCYSKEKQWLIAISDNGVGLDAETINNVNRMKKTITINNTMEQMESLSFGGLSFANVYIRLFLAYGNKAIFEVSNYEDGARIILGGEMSE